MTRMIVSCVLWTIPFSIHAWLGFGPTRILYIDDVRCGEAWPEGVMNPGPQPSGSTDSAQKDPLQRRWNQRIVGRTQFSEVRPHLFLSPENFRDFNLCRE